MGRKNVNIYIRFDRWMLCKNVLKSVVVKQIYSLSASYSYISSLKLLNLESSALFLLKAYTPKNSKYIFINLK